ncbi:FG-GAP repeat protein [Microlunatus spumicola]|uniref:FG-GAP repeat protein n=1 Tax=Microlunatus spumicola TaxID=81499 RepID=A0ABP6XEX6_9ACTN
MTSVRTRSWAALAGLAVPLALTAAPAHAATAAKPYDFDGNGRTDQVAGAPTLDRGSDAEAGGVVVRYARNASGSGRLGQVITQSTSKVSGSSEDGDHFGSAVASADFDGDGYADLAVGLPGEDFKGKQDAGAVTVLYGTSKGLSGSRSKQFSEPEGKYRYAGFGGALAAGDLNGDGYPDLAVGAVDDERDLTPDDDFPASGSVTILYGGKKGVTTSKSTRFLGQQGEEQDYHFGSSLAVADVDDDGRADVVVVSEGAGDDDDGNDTDGSLSYCAGTSAGPTGCRRLLHERSLGSASTVLVANVAGSARPEVVVGVPDNSAATDPGGITVVTLTGTGTATTASAADVDQEDAGLPGTGEESGDYFGASVAGADLDADGYTDLVVAAPGEAVGDEDAGRVFVIRGGADGLATSGNTAYDQDTPGVPGGSEEGDFFGGSLSLLDVDGDGRPDLSIGAPGEDDGGGRVTTLLGSGSGFTTDGARSYRVRDVDVNDESPYGGSLGEALGR